MPVFMPKPPVGVNRCAASPARMTRPAMKRSATSATPAVHGQWPRIVIGSSAPTARCIMSCDIAASVGGAPSSGALENTRNSSSLVERDDGARAPRD